ncbi:hypothetical protein N658DRAFT_233924 [Parathielavia hyrcaniae]|uniref:Uncharacterized protein n=1 Tax=Parathielavia hyrcaniae TaxID=113614 RepID=A0AAN6Q5C7_9PEZI|nr:hypothetical protein N658DRAFT_233924 [Parathielavia hyrcaniae]
MVFIFRVGAQPVAHWLVRGVLPQMLKTFGLAFLRSLPRLCWARGGQWQYKLFHGENTPLTNSSSRWMSSAKNAASSTQTGRLTARHVEAKSQLEPLRKSVQVQVQIPSHLECGYWFYVGTNASWDVLHDCASRTLLLNAMMNCSFPLQT